MPVLPRMTAPPIPTAARGGVEDVSVLIDDGNVGYVLISARDRLGIGHRVAGLARPGQVRDPVVPCLDVRIVGEGVAGHIGMRGMLRIDQLGALLGIGLRQEAFGLGSAQKPDRRNIMPFPSRSPRP